ncbi:PREDICTED: uncharacterized protein LOC109190185 [Ipomoea nil]|uniref:uncharacterized protein LOC109190185 n=1 Tax=Ipomoea nil TaxID=35883 RepID=UPI000901CC20|nr:PREDICTED: uncharacterized protein LOC109190185 [Ipomoea nil]
MEPWFNRNYNGHVIVIMQFCRAKRNLNSGEIKLSSSYDAPNILVNEDIPEIIEFKERLGDVHTPLRSVNTISSPSQKNTFDEFTSGSMVIYTISEVYSLRQCGDFWVVARIVEIESNRDWCYRSCKTRGCNKKLALNEKGILECYKCKKNRGDGVLRYRLKVRVVDRAGNAPFIIWDRECTELIGITTAELFEKYPQVRPTLPDEILAIRGVVMVFKIAARKEQFDNLHNAFAVMKIINDHALIDAYSPDLLENGDHDKEELIAEGDDEDFVSKNEVESSVCHQGSPKEFTDTGSRSLKRSLLDEFSSTESSKKTRDITFKKEKLA